MKTKFFKKLSFVLVVAMVLTLFVPAVGAFAAKAPELNSTKKYLHLDVDKKNEFNFNISNKGKGWSYAWESDNEDVAVVNEGNGVTTATGVGEAEITVYITDADGEDVDELTATVIVRDNIKEVTIKNPVDGTIAVGEEHDFDRSFVTVSGSTKKTSGITRWIIDPAEGATIDEKGVFVATEAGEYTVTALSFQSKARYNNWLEDPVAYAGEVLDTDETTVVVGSSIVETKQVDSSSFSVEFDTAMEDLTADKFSVYLVVGTTNVNQLVKEVKMSDDKKTATVTMYLPFTDESNYVVKVAGLEDSFKAAKVDAKEVASVELSISEMEYENSPKALTAVLKNAAGVDITTPALQAQVSYSLEDGSKGYLVGNDLYLFNKGDVAIVKITFNTMVFNETLLDFDKVYGLGTVTAVDTVTHTLGSATDMTLATSSPDWSKASVNKLAAGDTGYSVWARVKKTDDSYIYSETDTKFTFASSNDSVLIVDKFGTIYPVTKGTAIIICYYDDAPRATFAVEITDARKVVQFTPNKTTATITNSTSVAATDKFEITIKDQLGEDWAGTIGYSVEGLNGNPEGISPVDIITSYDTKEIAVTGAGATKGTWRYLVKGYDLQFMLTVNVQEPTVDGDLDEVKVWKLTLDKTTVDKAVANKDAVKSITPTLTGYAANGVACYVADFSTDKFSFKVNNVDQGNATSFVVTETGATIKTPTKDVSGPAITAVSGESITGKATGTYTVVAYQHKDGADIVRGNVVFSVVDNTKKATYVLENAVTSKTNLLEAVRDAFKVQFDGSDVDDEDLYNVEYVLAGTSGTDTDAENNVVTNVTIPSGTDVFIKSVKFMKNYDKDDDNDKKIAVEFTVDINRTIKIK